MGEPNLILTDKICLSCNLLSQPTLAISKQSSFLQPVSPTSWIFKSCSVLFHDYLVKLTISSCGNVPATFCWLAFPFWVALELVFSQKQIQLAVLLKYRVFCFLLFSPAPFLWWSGVGMVWPWLQIPKLAWVRQQQHGTKSSGEEWAEEWPFCFSKGNNFGSSPAWKWLLETGWNN